MSQPRERYAVTRGARWELFTRYTSNGSGVALTAAHFVQFRDAPSVEGALLLSIRTPPTGTGSRIDRADQVTNPGEETIFLSAAGTALLTPDIVYAQVVPVDGLGTQQPLWSFELVMCDLTTDPNTFPPSPAP